MAITNFDFWIAFVEPFALEGKVPSWVILRAGEAILAQKDYAKRTHNHTYSSDEDALFDFMAVHWAWFIPQPNLEAFSEPQPWTSSQPYPSPPSVSSPVPSSSSSSVTCRDNLEGMVALGSRRWFTPD